MTKWALVVGINNYRHLSQLKCAANDAGKIARQLVETCQFPRKNVFLLTDGRGADQIPSRDAILSCLDLLAEPGSWPDPGLFLFYFAGHGRILDEQGFLAMPETPEPGQRGAFTANALPVALVQEKISAIPASQKVVILDACRSTGDMGVAAGSRGEAACDELYGAFRDIRVRQRGTQPATVAWLFACQVGEKSWEMYDKEQSVFSYSLCESLTQAEGYPDGEITFSRVAELVDRKLTAWSAEHPAYAHRPEYSFRGFPRLVLGHSSYVKTRTRRLVQEGTEHFDAGRFDIALDKWKEAPALSPAEPGLREYIALAEKALRASAAGRQREQIKTPQQAEQAAAGHKNEARDKAREEQQRQALQQQERRQQEEQERRRRQEQERKAREEERRRTADARRAQEKLSRQLPRAGSVAMADGVRTDSRTATGQPKCHGYLEYFASDLLSGREFSIQVSSGAHKVEIKIYDGEVGVDDRAWWSHQELAGSPCMRDPTLVAIIRPQQPFVTILYLHWPDWCGCEEDSFTIERTCDTREARLHRLFEQAKQAKEALQFDAAIKKIHELLELCPGMAGLKEFAAEVYESKSLHERMRAKAEKEKEKERIKREVKDALEREALRRKQEEARDQIAFQLRDLLLSQPYDKELREKYLGSRTDRVKKRDRLRGSFFGGCSNALVSGCLGAVSGAALVRIAEWLFDMDRVGPLPWSVLGPLSGCLGPALAGGVAPNIPLPLSARMGIYVGSLTTTGALVGGAFGYPVHGAVAVAVFFVLLGVLVRDKTLDEALGPLPWWAHFFTEDRVKEIFIRGDDRDMWDGAALELRRVLLSQPFNKELRQEYLFERTGRLKKRDKVRGAFFGGCCGALVSGCLGAAVGAALVTIAEWLFHMDKVGALPWSALGPLSGCLGAAVCGAIVGNTVLFLLLFAIPCAAFATVGALLGGIFGYPVLGAVVVAVVEVVCVVSALGWPVWEDSLDEELGPLPWWAHFRTEDGAKEIFL